AHGTAVSGIIAAVGWNNIGVTGVAPQARLAGFQFLDSMQTTSMLLSQASGDFDIFNYSYGTGINMDVVDNAMYIAHLRERVTNGRNGKGQIFVKSAGNEYFGFSGNVPGIGNVFAPQNANIPEENNSPFIILAGATNA
ncbi:MAG: S8 family serine peptidase, partial [bacterium]